MRYISAVANATLYRNDGEIAIHAGDNKLLCFGLSGELIIGDPTTKTGDANTIDFSAQSPTTKNIMRVYPTDLDGNTVSLAEMCGQGTLTGETLTSAALTNIQDGWRYFFEAPTVSSITMPAAKNVAYKVLTGTLVYNGVSYGAGKVVESDGTTTTVTGTFTAHLTIPGALAKVCDNPSGLACLFKLEHMLTGEESNDYWQLSPFGAEPMDDLLCTDPNFIGYI